MEAKAADLKKEPETAEGKVTTVVQQVNEASKSDEVGKGEAPKDDSTQNASKKGHGKRKRQDFFRKKSNSKKNTYRNTPFMQSHGRVTRSHTKRRNAARNQIDETKTNDEIKLEPENEFKLTPEEEDDVLKVLTYAGNVDSVAENEKV